MPTNTEAVAVTETRLIHEFHRRATTLLSEAALRPSVPLAALAELREFLVKNLRHHHETEDHQLWPMIEPARTPSLGDRGVAGGGAFPALEQPERFVEVVLSEWGC
ncbi:hemerythrin domain-containing protein [Nonomuraea sp. NPDC050022]|uniref:hemerythrin domain-containing protein n=1 Tax=unclassified Nonomuraea TaxID=2593643 RepID=UPI003405EA00